MGCFTAKPFLSDDNVILLPGGFLLYIGYRQCATGWGLKFVTALIKINPSHKWDDHENKNDNFMFHDYEAKKAFFTQYLIYEKGL